MVGRHYQEYFYSQCSNDCSFKKWVFFLENSSTQFHHGNFFTNMYWKWQAYVDGLSIIFDLSSFPFSKHGYKSTATIITSVIKLDVRLANCFEGVYDLRDCVYDSWFWMSHCVNWASSSHSWNWDFLDCKPKGRPVQSAGFTGLNPNALLPLKLNAINAHHVFH